MGQLMNDFQERLYLIFTGIFIASLGTIHILAFFLIQIEQLHCLMISKSVKTSN